MKTTHAFAAMAGVLLLLTGCASADAEEPAPLTFEEETLTPLDDDTTIKPTEPAEDVVVEEPNGQLLPAGYMPIIISRQDIPPITVRGDFISNKEAKDVMEWAASLAWIAVNDAALRQPAELNERTIDALLPYLTDNAAQRALTGIRSYLQTNDITNPDVLTEKILQEMFFIISPDNAGLGTYENDPIYSNVSIVNPVIERVESKGTEPTYQVTFDVTAMTYIRPNPELCAQADNPEDCNQVFYLGMATQHEWVIEATGDDKVPYLLDSWNPRGVAFGNLTPISE